MKHINLQDQAANRSGVPNNVAIPHEMEFRVKPEFLRVLHTLEDIDRNKEVFTYLDVSTVRLELGTISFNM